MYNLRFQTLSLLAFAFLLLPHNRVEAGILIDIGSQTMKGSDGYQQIFGAGTLTGTLSRIDADLIFTEDTVLETFKDDLLIVLVDDSNEAVLLMGSNINTGGASTAIINNLALGETGTKKNALTLANDVQRVAWPSIAGNDSSGPYTSGKAFTATGAAATDASNLRGYIAMGFYGTANAGLYEATWEDGTGSNGGLTFSSIGGSGGAVPEPSTCMIFAFGLFGIAGVRRRRR